MKSGILTFDEYVVLLAVKLLNEEGTPATTEAIEERVTQMLRSLPTELTKQVPASSRFYRMLH
jgi:hypothetical protein